jgi:hypothetical protein
LQRAPRSGLARAQALVSIHMAGAADDAGSSPRRLRPRRCVTRLQDRRITQGVRARNARSVNSRGGDDGNCGPRRCGVARRRLGCTVRVDARRDRCVIRPGCTAKRAFGVTRKRLCESGSESDLLLQSALSGRTLCEQRPGQARA